MINTINARQVTEHSRQYMDSLGLQAVAFKLNSNKRRLGVCKFRRDRWLGTEKCLQVELSVYVFPLGWAEIEKTLKHECAHAIAGSKAGHGPEFVRVCQRLGIPGDRCGPVMSSIEHKFTMRCSNGCWSKPVHKRKRNRICLRCQAPVVFDFNEDATRVKVRTTADGRTVVKKTRHRKPKPLRTGPTKRQIEKQVLRLFGDLTF